MATIVTCSTCGAKLQLKQIPASGKFKCPKCGAVSFAGTPTAATVIAAPASDKFIGRTIGGHKIQSVLAQDEFTTVYKATQISMRRPVAVKVLPPERAQPQQVEQFFARAKAAAKLTHPAIVSIYDMGTENNASYFSMEYVEGATVEQLLKQRGLPPVEEAVKIAVEAARALSYALQSGVVNHNLTPQTVMLSNKGEVKLLSSLVEGGAGEKSLPTTGIGRLLYHLLTGRNVVPGKRPEPAAKYNPNVTPPVERVLNKMLSTSEANSFSGLDEAIDALEKSIHRRPVHRAEEPRGRAPAEEAHGRYRPRRSNAATILLIVCGLCMVGLLIAGVSTCQHNRSKGNVAEENALFASIRTSIDAGKDAEALKKCKEFKERFPSSGYMPQIDKATPGLEKRVEVAEMQQGAVKEIEALMKAAEADPSKQPDYVKELDEIQKGHSTVPGIGGLIKNAKDRLKLMWTAFRDQASERAQKYIQERKFGRALEEGDKLKEACKGDDARLARIESNIRNIELQMERDYADVEVEAGKLADEKKFKEAIEKYQFVVDNYGVEKYVQKAKAEIEEIKKQEKP